MQDDKTVTILVADDDPGDQELTRRAFEQASFACDLRFVSDGEEALEYLRHTGRYADHRSAPRPDLVLLDLNMPKIDGRQVLVEMRSERDFRSIPVIALTTSSREDDIIRTYEIGVNSFITKPVDIDRFIEVVRSIGHYWFEVVHLPAEARR